MSDGFVFVSGERRPVEVLVFRVEPERVEEFLHSCRRNEPPIYWRTECPAGVQRHHLAVGWHHHDAGRRAAAARAQGEH